ncbi:hypothetical protein F4778DRAFT_749463 [Xylariomycetidae sp. FL2044]|nr:hypothetical protein F4778DRAFT_749463 [Xylariomycetidae sp. FL2044]
MADPLSISSALVGICSFAIQVNSGVNSLRKIRRFNRDEAANEIKTLSNQLGTLHTVLESLESTDQNPTTKAIVEQCAEIYARVDQVHSRIALRLNDTQSRGNSWKSARLSFSSEVKEAIDDIDKKLLRVIMMLQLAVVCDLGSGRLLNQKLEQLQQSILTSRKTEETTLKIARVTQDTKVLQTTAEASSPSGVISIPRSRKVDCALRSCPCSCHLVGTTQRRFWSFEFTPLSAFLGQCDRKECTARRNQWSARLALSQWGIPFAVSAGVHLVSQSGKYCLQPSLSVQRIVKYTSPGFEAIAKCQEGLITPQEACKKLGDLARSDSSFKVHVDPAGNGYIECLLRYPWGHNPGQFAILDFLVRDLGLSLDRFDQEFLVNCAAWISHGPHLSLLQTVIDYGFDPDNIHSPHTQQWPSPCSSDWSCADLVPDPFYVEYIGMLNKRTYDFAGSPPLHRAIHHRDSEAVERWIARSEALEETRNFLGQTPLHVAVCDLSLSCRLLDAGHNPDVTDDRGITPLMYAAGMGETDIARMLITNGANLFIYQPDESWGFLEYAVARQNWDLIINLLGTIETCYDEGIHQRFVRAALVKAMTDWWIGIGSHIGQAKTREKYCRLLIKLCKDVNFRIDDCGEAVENNNLMHYAGSVEVAEVLVSAGFSLFHQTNSRGETALFSVVRKFTDTSLFSFCLGKSNLRHVDNDGHGVLYKLVGHLGSDDWFSWDAIDPIRCCLAAGASISQADNCRCSCAPNGCKVTASFNINFDHQHLGHQHLPGCIWTLEWMSLVEDHQGEEAAKETLIDFFRRAAGDDIGLQHTCCHKGSGIKKPHHYVWTLFQTPRRTGIEMGPEARREILENRSKEVELLESAELGDLTSRWIELLKERYDSTVSYIHAERKRERESKSPQRPPRDEQFTIDSERDEFFYPTIHVPLRQLWLPDIKTTIANYALWLEHDHSKRRSSSAEHSKVTEQYRRRLRWLSEFLERFEVGIEEISAVLLDSDARKYKTDPPNTEELVKRFTASMEDWRSSGRDEGS